MEMKVEEAQVCRLCGQCESIYIDVFGEEGTKRFLGLKIYKKVNIVISKDDGLSHYVCMKCIATMEFVDDFRERCWRTQEKLNEEKERENRENHPEQPKPSTSVVEEDMESDKENTCPNTTTGVKRKRGATPMTAERTKEMKPKPLGERNMTLTESVIETSANKQLQKCLNQITVQAIIESCNTVQSTPIPEVKKETSADEQSNMCLNQITVQATIESFDTVISTSTAESKYERNPKRAKLDIAQEMYDKIERCPLPGEEESINGNQRVQTRGKRRAPKKKPVTEKIIVIDQPKGTPVPVIVKLEKQENVLVHVGSSMSETVIDSTLDVDAMTKIPILAGAEQAKPLQSEVVGGQSPTAGDEPAGSPQRSPEMSSTRSPSIEDAPIVSVRKTVIETPKKTIEKMEQSEIPCGRETRLTTGVLKKTKTKEVVQVKEEKKIKKATKMAKEGVNNRPKYPRISTLLTTEQKNAVEKGYRFDRKYLELEAVGRQIAVRDNEGNRRKRFQCKMCLTNFPRLDKCRVHVWGHLNIKPYRCNNCHFATVTSTNMKCHITKTHLKCKPYICKVCDKRYGSSFHLDEHMNVHTGEKPHKCPHCDFRCASKQVLSYHKTSHKPQKDMECAQCKKTFFSKARLRAHVVIHISEKDANMCKLCSTRLCSSESLQRHIARAHSQPHPCENCDKVFKTKKALNNHKKVHLPPMYKCHLCPRSYKSTHILKEHILKHQGVRKYKCTKCEKDFAQQSHLAAHMAVHSDVRFHCPACDRAFNRHDNMKGHTKICAKFAARPELAALLKIRRKRNSGSSEEATTKLLRRSVIHKAVEEEILKRRRNVGQATFTQAT